MITEFGGFKIGDRVKHIKDDAIGTVIRFDSDWLAQNPDAEVFDLGIVWDDADLDEGFVDWHFSNKIEKISVNP